MSYFRKIFFVILILSITAYLFATENVTAPAKATINKKRIFIGDRIRYKVNVVASGGPFEVEFPQFKDNKIGDCEIKDSGKGWLDITSYYVGKRNIPSIEIKYRKKGDKAWKAAKTVEIAFTVESVLPKGVKLRDIKDIKGPLYPFSLLKLLLYIASALLAIFLILLILKKMKKKTPPKLPFEIAFEELEEARRGLTTGGDAKEYYVKISDIIRKYIETVFSLRAPEMTTQEFLMSLNDSPKLSRTHKDSLQAFMEACDLVKFAKHVPSMMETEAVFVTAKKFIEETKGPYVPI